MRFFPRDAFKNLPDTPVQIPIAQLQFQQQTWQQMGIPMVPLQVPVTSPFLLPMLRILAQQQAHPMLLALQGDLLRIHQYLSNLALHPIGLGGFGWPGY